MVCFSSKQDQDYFSLNPPFPHYEGEKNKLPGAIVQILKTRSVEPLLNNPFKIPDPIPGNSRWVGHTSVKE